MTIEPGQIWQMTRPSLYSEDNSVAKIGDKFLISDWDGRDWWIIDSQGNRWKSTSTDLIAHCTLIIEE